ncbi:MAG: NYN domain-containing protein [Eggerthellaceae bacterium]|nr:NYN domain-containing protein [Eggerthellaceae bacterium]
MAILVDGAFYLKRAKSLFGQKSPADRAEELVQYCKKHTEHEGAELYRIFYYDCDPVGKKAFHPLLHRTIDLSKTDDYKWKMEFFGEIARKRKLAVRKGEALDGSCEYVLKREVARDLVVGKRTTESLIEKDFVLDVQQKGVDVRIGLDLALISHEKFADQIVLITGDSDFVPAAKYARRHGIDFIIDPMWHNFRDELGVHVDGMYTPCPNPKRKKR